MSAGGTLNTSTEFRILNFTVVRIDPGGKEVSVDWKGYNVRSGNAFNVPFEIVDVCTAEEAYCISDEKAGNNELTINGETYKFDSQNEQLVISFGAGVSIEPGGDYQSAQDPYDHKFSP